MRVSRSPYTPTVDRRRGYTLIEMLIVCAVLAALAGISWPAMRNMLTKGRLQQGADHIQTVLRKARIEAVRSGNIMVFRYEPGGRKYRVDSWESLTEENGIEPAGDLALSTDDTALLAEPIPQLPPAISPVTEELPDGIRFASADHELEADSMSAIAAFDDATELAGETSQTGNSLTEPEWSKPIVFQSNGRSGNAQLRLMDSRRFVIDLSLRGLTGIVTAAAPVRLREEQAQDLLPTDEEPPLDEISMGGSQ